jgi:putative phage-type endonuclease
MSAGQQSMHPIAKRMLERPQWVQRTESWYERRKTLITASDAGSALNIPAFKGQKNSRDEAIKTKVTGSFKGNIFTRWGQEMEPHIASLVEQVFDDEVLEVGLLVHPTHDWLGASPDGVMKKTGQLVEIKAPYKRQLGGDNAAYVPATYYAQMQVQMQVAQAYQTIFAQWQPADKNDRGEEILDITVIDRDDAWFAQHKHDLRRFWEDLMEARRTYVAPSTRIDAGIYDDLV